MDTAARTNMTKTYCKESIVLFIKGLPSLLTEEIRPNHENIWITEMSNLLLVNSFFIQFSQQCAHQKLKL